MLTSAPLCAYFPACGLDRARRYLLRANAGPHTQRRNQRRRHRSLCQRHRRLPVPNVERGSSRASGAFCQVDDGDRRIEELKARGVPFEQYPDMPGEHIATGAVTAGAAKAAWGNDSQGNIMVLIQAL